MEAEPLVFHYTVINPCIFSILQDRVIKLADSYMTEGERPVVWCTKSLDWENTANLAFVTSLGKTPLDRDQTHKAAGLARIAILASAAPYTWDQWVKKSGVWPKMASSLKKRAYQLGSKISEWRVSFEPIRASSWRAIHKWDGVQWREWINPPFPIDNVDRS